MSSAPHSLLYVAVLNALPCLANAAGFIAPAQAATVLSPVVVTASSQNEAQLERKSAYLQKIVISEEDVARYGDATVGDVLRRLPGMSASGPAGVSKDVRIRGSRPVKGGGERISADLLATELAGLADTDFYLCAGTQLLDSMLAALKDHGVADDALHFEQFTLGAAAESDANWTVAFAGRHFHFGQHASLLDAIEAQQLPIDSDYLIGSCGRCLVKVEYGEVSHRIEPECPVPAGAALACCAIPASHIQLRALQTSQA